MTRCLCVYCYTLHPYKGRLIEQLTRCAITYELSSGSVGQVGGGVGGSVGGRVGVLPLHRSRRLMRRHVAGNAAPTVKLLPTRISRKKSELVEEDQNVNGPNKGISWLARTGGGCIIKRVVGMATLELKGAFLMVR